MTIEDYNILKVLGSGACGKVFLVEDKNSLTWYAMKVIKKE